MFIYPSRRYEKVRRQQIAEDMDMGVEKNKVYFLSKSNIEDRSLPFRRTYLRDSY